MIRLSATLTMSDQGSFEHYVEIASRYPLRALRDSGFVLLAAGEVQNEASPNQDMAKVLPTLRHDLSPPTDLFGRLRLSYNANNALVGITLATPTRQ